MIGTMDASKSVAALMKEFGRMQQKQVPYALSKTINSLLLRVQDVERGAQHQRFTVRRVEFLRRLVKIGAGDWATKQRLLGRVGYQGPKADLLAKFEDGGPKRTLTGARPWVPQAARRNKSDVITRSNRPKGLGLKPFLVGVQSGYSIFKGNKRTFMIRARDGSGVVLQRYGNRPRGRRKGSAQDYGSMNGVRTNRTNGTRTLFVYLRRDPSLPASLEFLKRANAVLERSLGPTFRAQMQRALWGNDG